MTIQSKEGPQHDEQKLALRQKRLKAMNLHICAQVVTLTLTVQATPALAASLCQGDMARVARFLAACTASTSAFEFLVSPTLGPWCDANGRKQMMMLGPLVNAVLPLLFALAPKSLPLMALATSMWNAANGVSGSTTSVAAMQDICAGDMKQFTSAMVGFSAMAGLGVVLGPGIGGLVLAKTRNPSAVYAVRALFSLLHLLWLRGAVEETLTDDRRRPFDGKPRNPFNFFDLFTTSSMLSQVTVFNMLQCLAEGKCINDLNQMWMKGPLGWDISSTARWTVGYGVMMVFNGAVLMKNLMPKLGPRAFVTMANFAGISAMLTNGGIHRGWAFTLGLFLNTPAINAMGGAPVKAAGAIKAGEAGMGNGEYQAKFANLRSLVYIIGPQLYLRIFAKQVAANRNPGAAYFLCALLGFAVPELIHQRWSDDDLLSKKD